MSSSIIASSPEEDEDELELDEDDSYVYCLCFTSVAGALAYGLETISWLDTGFFYSVAGALSI